MKRFIEYFFGILEFGGLLVGVAALALVIAMAFGFDPIPDSYCEPEPDPRAAFMQECTEGMPESQCEVIWQAIEASKQGD